MGQIVPVVLEKDRSEIERLLGGTVEVGPIVVRQSGEALEVCLDRFKEFVGEDDVVLVSSASNKSLALAWDVLTAGRDGGWGIIIHVHDTRREKIAAPPPELLDAFQRVTLNILRTRSSWHSVGAYEPIGHSNGNQQRLVGDLLLALHKPATKFRRAMVYTGPRSGLRWSKVVSGTQTSQFGSTLDAWTACPVRRYLEDPGAATIEPVKVSVNPVHLFLSDGEQARAQAAVKFATHNNGKLRYAVPAVNLHYRENAVGYPARGILIDGNGNILSGGKKSQFDFISEPAIAVTEPCFWGFNVLHKMYYHWLLNGLAGIRNLESIGITSGMRFVVPVLSSWQRDSLCAMGVRPEAILELGREPVRFAKVFWSDFSSANDHPDLVHPAALSFVRAKARAAADASRSSNAEASWPEKIYVSRLDTNKRKLLNEDQLAEALERAGFFVLIGSKHSFIEQRNIFAGAKVICGLHGAGMTNGLFCGSGVPILEIYPENFFHAGSLRACQMAGSRHGLMFGRNLKVNPDDYQDVQWEVDIPEVLMNLKELEEKPYTLTWESPFDVAGA
ncbi:glycosyltransferase family 61 protein [Chelatococcus reniformis]|uniref:Glycosyltransferase 61 catalytic domain-containing protein n=1 Tax=Chelatococcus reniformis TaxID=1494448 RepID=A0A916UYZ8_9HYPH|nr:glycosyltransferase family 61 protein [Chelatococcus reniformis]GGC94966.1 hypothetical protein GCM10010994_60850 [Chelatococcus reniformis]